MVILALCLYLAPPGPVEFKTPNAILSLAFSPDGKMLATGNNKGEVTLWDAATGRKLMDGARHHGLVRGLAFAPNGKTVYSGDIKGNLVAFDVEGFRNRAEARTPRVTVRSLSVSPDGSALAAVTNGDEIHLYKTDGLKLAKSLKVADMKETLHSVAFSPDGKKLLVGGQVMLNRGAHFGTFRVWDIASEKGEKAVECPPLMMKPGDRISYKARCAWSPDGKAWAGVAEDRVLLVRGKEVTPITAKEATDIAFTPDSATLIIAEKSGPVRLITTATGKETHKLKGWPIAYSALALSPDGKRLAIAGGGGKITIRLLASAMKED